MKNEKIESFLASELDHLLSKKQCHITNNLLTSLRPSSSVSKRLLSYGPYGRPRARFHCNVKLREQGRGKSCTALLGTRNAMCNAILGDFVDFKHPSHLEPQKQMQTIYWINFLCKFLFVISSKRHILSAHEKCKEPL